MKKPKTIAALVVILLIVFVLWQNSRAIEVKFLFWSFPASAFVMYLIFYLIGVISAFIGMLWRKI